MPPRFICLPGYLQSGKHFAEKSSGLRKSLSKKKYELVYIDPPVVIKSKEELPFKLSEDEEEATAKWNDIVERNLNRAWWQHNDKTGYEGFQQSLDFLVGYVKEHGPFDGIIGFSQGAAMASIFTNSIKSLLGQQFKVSVLFSGFVFTVPRYPDVDNKFNLNYDIKDVNEYAAKVKIVSEYEKYYLKDSAISTKIINILGTEDMTVPFIRSEYLSYTYKDKAPIVEYRHDGGHYIPNKKQFLNPIIDDIVCEISEDKASL